MKSWKEFWFYTVTLQRDKSIELLKKSLFFYFFSAVVGETIVGTLGQTRKGKTRSLVQYLEHQPRLPWCGSQRFRFVPFMWSPTIYRRLLTHDIYFTFVLRSDFLPSLFVSGCYPSQILSGTMRSRIFEKVEINTMQLQHFVHSFSGRKNIRNLF